jgi:AcrR family transcriptional regulator
LVAGSGRQNADFVLVAALAGGRTVCDVAAAVGVSERTIYRRLESADFRRRVGDARAEMVQRAVGQLADASAEAVTTLRALVTAAESETVRLGAARAVLELGSKLRESVELEERVRRLEEGRGA